MKILIRNDFEAGCQFQLINSHEKSPLYITEYNQLDALILLDYQFACEYGRDLWMHLFRVQFSGPDFFAVEYKILGQTEINYRYYKDFKIVNFKKHYK